MLKQRDYMVTWHDQYFRITVLLNEHGAVFMHHNGSAAVNFTGRVDTDPFTYDANIIELLKNEYGYDIVVRIEN